MPLLFLQAVLLLNISSKSVGQGSIYEIFNSYSTMLYVKCFYHIICLKKLYSYSAYVTEMLQFMSGHPCSILDILLYTSHKQGFVFFLSINWSKEGEKLIDFMPLIKCSNSRVSYFCVHKEWMQWFTAISLIITTVSPAKAAFDLCVHNTEYKFLVFENFCLKVRFGKMNFCGFYGWKM